MLERGKRKEWTGVGTGFRHRGWPYSGSGSLLPEVLMGVWTILCLDMHGNVELSTCFLMRKLTPVLELGSIFWTFPIGVRQTCP